MAEFDPEPALAARQQTPIDLTDSTPDPDSEPEDDSHQDYRFLTSSSRHPISNQKDHVLPRRGEKDFEPHGTQAQSSTLLASQEAMREALSHERHHGPTGEKSSSNLTGVFDLDTGLIYVAREVGQILQKMGKAVRGGRGGVMLEPEEALFLLERGTLQILYPAVSSQHGTISGPDDSASDGLVSLEGLGMSLQAAYACCIGTRELSLERYIVYAGLKRAGYSVFRAKGGWGDDPEQRLGQSSPVSSSPLASSLQSWLQGLAQNLLPTKRPSLPILGSTFFRDYSTIYNRLAIIPSHTAPFVPQSQAHNHHQPLTISYHAYKPSTPLKKSSLPPPDFYISVLDARDTSFPTATQITNLLVTIPSETPTRPPEGQRTNLYTTLKTGAKHVLLAVVDSGLVSYIRVAEGVFASEKVWERNPIVRPQGKGSGPGSNGAGRGGKNARGGRGGKGKGGRG